jgi:threonine dehydratase
VTSYVRRTPVLDTDLGLLKAESLQVAGSFKARGAFNKVLRLLEEAKEGGPPVTGLAAVSSGNHAQAVALAGRALGLAVAVVMPGDSRPNKVAATRDLGATVVTEGVTVESRQARLAELLEETGYQLVHPFDDWDVIHGQGTAALEVLEDHPGVATVVVPVGGGGLISGTALVLKAAARQAARPLRVIGAEPEQAPDGAESLRTGTHVHRPAGPTLADGARVPAIGDRPFEVIVERGLVDDIVVVPEEAILAATVALADRAHLVVEPTGALAVAAVRAGLVPGAPDGPTVAYLSGGNIDPRHLSDLAATVHSA